MKSRFGKTGYGPRNSAAARELGNKIAAKGVPRSIAFKAAWKAVKKGNW